MLTTLRSRNPVADLVPKSANSATHKSLTAVAVLAYAAHSAAWIAHQIAGGTYGLSAVLPAGCSDACARAVHSDHGHRWACGGVRVALAVEGRDSNRFRRYFAPITSRSFAVSTYCWNRVSLPSLTSQTWQTCASMLLPVAL